ncbi:uroporphyrinogen decarboxylase family protein [Verrucomicrobiota bacterium]
MTTRDRVLAVLNLEPFDRLPVVEWAGWWDRTIDRWHSEGLPADVTDRYDICRHFGLDVLKQDWMRSRAPGCPEAKSHGAGILASEQDYERIRECLYPLPVVDRERWACWAGEQKRGEVALWFTVEGFFWFPRTLLGIERHLYAFYDQPALMHRMNEDLSNWMLAVIDELCSVCVPDFMTFAEDMSYNHGPMVSEQLFEEFMAPYYRKVVPALRERGIITIIDSDGDVSVPAHWFERVGLEGILPLERQAGVDIAALRAEHPRMRFIGHFDKMVMNKGEARMRAEFERLLPTARKGGYFISCDHQTPPGVSYEDYMLYLSLFKEYAVKAAT